MKATTVIVMLVVMGLLFELDVVPGVSTLGGEIVDNIMPEELGGTRTNWKLLVLVTAGVLSIGVVLLGNKLPYAALLSFLTSMMFAPISIMTDTDLGMPNTVKIIFGIVWLGMFVSAAVSMFRSDA